MQIDRGRLPALGADPQLRFPEIQRRTLANGLRVWTIQHEAVPLVSFLAMLPVGASADPQDRPGLAAIIRVGVAHAVCDFQFAYLNEGTDEEKLKRLDTICDMTKRFMGAK